MNTITRMLISASLLAIAGGVSAEPVTLSATQMDGVNAGGVFLAQGAASATGGALAVSNLVGLTAAGTLVVVTPTLGVVASGAESGAIAVSSYNPLTPSTNGAAAASVAASSAALF